MFEVMIVSHFPVLKEAITDQRAWRADTIDPSATWYYRLSDACVSALEQVVLSLRRERRPVTVLRISESLRAVYAEDVRPVLEAFETGRGFAIIEGLPIDRYSTDEAQAMYWLVGQLLGRPIEQNVQGTLLYDVRDTGQDVQYGARFSVTSAESTFHTDNSFGDEVTDYVGLLCLRTAKSGGIDQLVSGYTLHNELAANHPDLLEILYRPFHVDRRGGVKAGEALTAKVPILRWDGQGLIYRYLRYWIEAGHEKVGEPLTPVQVEALNCLDRTVRCPDSRVEFHLRPGQMLFINNRWILHNRSAFEDYPELERRRHYVRLWLKAEHLKAETKEGKL